MAMNPYLSMAVGGLNLFQGVLGYNSAKSQARALASQGEQVAENRAKQIDALASSQRMAYGKSGIEISGTAQNVINDTYNTGREDVEAIRSSYQKQVKNAILQGRSSFLNSLFSGSSQIYNGASRLS